MEFHTTKPPNWFCWFYYTTTVAAAAHAYMLSSILYGILMWGDAEGEGEVGGCTHAYARNVFIEFAIESAQCMQLNDMLGAFARQRLWPPTARVLCVYVAFHAVVRLVGLQYNI